jgi:hypothetical protein
MYATCLVSLALIGGSGSGSLDDPNAVAIDAAVKNLTPRVQTGTLLTTKGDCLAVKVFSQSGTTHVATVVMQDGKPVVFDSANGVGVRCLSLRAYLKSQGTGDVHVYTPVKKFSTERAKKFEDYLDTQLGRPYAVKHHLTGNRVKGLHCAELMTDTLVHCRMLKVNNPARVTPASLIKGVTVGKLYSESRKVTIAALEVTEPPAKTWYGRAWQSTRQTSQKAYKKTKSLVLCD